MLFTDITKNKANRFSLLQSTSIFQITTQERKRINNNFFVPTQTSVNSMSVIYIYTVVLHMKSTSNILHLGNANETLT